MILTIAQVSEDTYLSLLVPQIAAGLMSSGGSQSTALVLASPINIVAVTPVGTGVRLPAPMRPIQVINRGVNDLLVYPWASCWIEAQAVNVPVIIPAGGSATFVPKSATSSVVI